MEKFEKVVQLAKDITLGGQKMVLIAGPCAVESYDICIKTAETVKEICANLDIAYVFKASYDKANRTSSASFRSIGMHEGLETLHKVGNALDIPLLTDVHESSQVESVAQVADILQIPAFLCRQTDLLIAAAMSGRALNIKKGQFMAPGDMKYAIDKIKNSGNENGFLTERGTSFGYHNLVVDMRGLPILRKFAPVIFDVTHSIQQPGAAGGSSGGQKEFAPFLARAAGAAGIDGYFVETHPNPEVALSDGPNMIPLHEMKNFIIMLQESWRFGNKFA